MNSSTMARIVFVAGCVLLMCHVMSPFAKAADAGVIPAQFENSCSEAVQDEFNQAVTLLHSFEYPETTRRFSEIIEKDPGCAMARWGAAMSIWHPLWAPPGKAELERGELTLLPAEFAWDEFPWA